MDIDKGNLKQIRIAPVNDVSLCSGCENIHPEYITNENMQLVKNGPLKEKTIYFYPGGGMASGSGVLKDLSLMGLKPCENAGNYLLGFCVYIKQNTIDEFKDAAFISLDVNSSFIGPTCECVMHVDQKGDVSTLTLTAVKDGFSTTFCNDWFFLAEEK